MTWETFTIQQISPVTILLVFAGGVVTSIGPCNVAMIPLIIGYVGGGQDRTRWRSFYLSTSFAIGLAVTFMLLGIVASAFGGMVGSQQRWFYYIVATVCILMGLQFFGVITLPIPDLLAAQREKIRWRGAPGALALGLVSGLVASQCATPVLAAILTYAMATGTTAYGALLLFVYALGRGVPIIAAGTFAGVLQHLMALRRWTPVVERISGIVLIGVGLYLIWLA